MISDCVLNSQARTKRDGAQVRLQHPKRPCLAEALIYPADLKSRPASKSNATVTPATLQSGFRAATEDVVQS